MLSRNFLNFRNAFLASVDVLFDKVSSQQHEEEKEEKKCLRHSSLEICSRLSKEFSSLSLSLSDDETI